MTSVKVKASRNYEVYIGAGLLDKSGTYIYNIIPAKTAAVITDGNVDALYSRRLIKSLEDSGYKTVKYVLESGEQSKNASNYIALLNFLADNRITRSDVIIALGGGVVGDIAGFAAATYLRGITFIQIPTTLLAAVDSSVGGKTAINLDTGKNLAGAFYQPSLVICDTDTLSTLEEEEFSNGCAEVIKYGVIADKLLFEELLEIPVENQLEKVITKCVEIKRDFISGDEFDKGRRQLLNFGHTVGHAIEACSNYTVPHGRAVAAGMAIIAKASAFTGICSMDCYDDIVRILEMYSLPESTAFGYKDIVGCILSDKKRSGDIINLVVPEYIGKCRLSGMPVEDAEPFIKAGLTGGKK